MRANLAFQLNREFVFLCVFATKLEINLHELFIVLLEKVVSFLFNCYL